MSEEQRKIDRAMLIAYSKLRQYPNVISFSVTANKRKNDNDTGVRGITVFVSQKLDKSYMMANCPEDILPEEIDGVPIDVVELSTEDFELGETSKSKLSPFIQRRIAGGVKKE